MRLFVTGTVTDVGKTVFSAALAGALQASYWKPIQAGSLAQSDSDIVRRLSGLGASNVLAEAYRFAVPCSPHRAAEQAGISIMVDQLQPPEMDPLIVEGAGGLLVPVTRALLMIELIERWKLPVVLVSRTSVGTINHSLLSIEALRSRDIPLLGVAFVGGPNPDSEEIICSLGPAKRLGRLPLIYPLDRPTLHKRLSTILISTNFDEFTDLASVHPAWAGGAEAARRTSRRSSLLHGRWQARRRCDLVLVGDNARASSPTDHAGDCGSVGAARPDHFRRLDP